MVICSQKRTKNDIVSSAENELGMVPKMSENTRGVVYDEEERGGLLHSSQGIKRAYVRCHACQPPLSSCARHARKLIINF